MTLSLNGANALVSGSGSGIGRGIALELARAGAVVAIADMDLSKADAVAQELSTVGGKAISVHLDVTRETSVHRCVEDVIRRLDHVDILVNNAGIFQRCLGLEIEEEDFSRCLDVNLTGIWRLTKQLVPHFRSQGAGKVVNISSTGGRRGIDFAPAYCASKAGVISLTQSLASALGSDGINVNAICPGSISTAMRDEIVALGASVSKASAGGAGGAAYALPGTLTVEDIGRAVVFFCSDYARNITGQALNVDRGFHMN
jgi:NAD(P)-dependent dehydrogenase (short-subunit alcohol dehydrogenase family)